MNIVEQEMLRLLQHLIAGDSTNVGILRTTLTDDNALNSCAKRIHLLILVIVKSGNGSEEYAGKKRTKTKVRNIEE